ncbi:T9SS type A sorting domain-containing protein [Crocinitomix catalasitica]|uniref:T9SS type A sorting domain-containing protein n=1 Tax=Crocinitomix catalasitica TaxID=184607 RepID=UPI0004828C09|nr:T9SS type A sorting domain-containing protein [Crocinitomix catalasitica]
MKLSLSFIIASFFAVNVNAQFIELPTPKSHSTDATPEWNSFVTRAPGDSCGVYFNNYIGLQKTSLLFFEGLRTGNGIDFSPYSGRGQRFHANQPIEVSGAEFYSFHTNEDLDSIMAITILYDYDAMLDSTGAELARDTVYVKHTAFTPDLPEISIKSYFDTPVTVTDDYIIAVITTTDDSLKIITNDASGDGAGEGVSFAYYENPAAPSYTGWYPTLPTFGPAYDIDYLISPRVKFQLQDGFTIIDDEVCPNIISAACVEYVQAEIFSDPHYNRNSADPVAKVNWNWDDGLQNSLLLELCHTYENSGTYSIMLRDTLTRFFAGSSLCPFEISNEILVLDSTIADFDFTPVGHNVNFSDESNLVDSVFFDFGDGSEGSTDPITSHIYDETGEYDVWFYAYGPCSTDSIMKTVTVTDLGIEELEISLKMYPNPANSELFIDTEVENYQLNIINILGEVIITENNITGLKTIDVSRLTTGAYFVDISNDNIKTVEKLIIKH